MENKNQFSHVKKWLSWFFAARLEAHIYSCRVKMQRPEAISGK